MRRPSASKLIEAARSIDTPLVALDKVALERSVSSPANKQTAKSNLFGAANSPGGDVYPFGQLNPFETDFTEHVVVAQGGFGKVFKCRSKLDQRHYAIKLEQFYFAPKAIFNPMEIRDTMLREAQVLASLDHENVCRYYHTWIFGKLVSANSNLPPASAVSSTADADNSSTGRRIISSNDDKDSKERSSSDSSLFSEVDDDSFGFEFDRNALSTDNESQADIARKAMSPATRQKSQLCLQMDVYIQMALYHGNSLQHWLNDRKVIDTATNIAIFRQIVAGLKYIHAQGLIHRDIKPANIFLTLDACVKIGDFGLATHMTHSSAAAAGIGTPLYSSPEQLRGDVCTPAADVFSLGLVLCELFCQFDTQMEKHVTLTSLTSSTQRQLPPSVPQDIAAIIRRLVHPDPVQRPSCPEIELMEALAPSTLSLSALRMRSWTSTSVDSQGSDDGRLPVHPVHLSDEMDTVVAALERIESQQGALLGQLPPSPQVDQLVALANHKKGLLTQLRRLVSW
ncbi:unnamed protein product [Aphanomyces euteiches]|uniref:non-specific serine/threonine protein kinase n=2 Tax=Aphanomyces euteiches TaxID=100861 RepID=A0A6G0XH53_9STRA|nr:hypothetical protein Ae201684_004819 [Aphanomyces euteiches]KAH9073250.1 hypothetical protein Ae201684P_015067 [Aphanomyces euteiches]KAH9155027.1 hypothetical protein AeRB84_002965 [Aphanomyces euteiches]